MVRTRQYSIAGNESYIIYINGIFFAQFFSIEYGNMLARAISLALFHALPDQPEKNTTKPPSPGTGRARNKKMNKNRIYIAFSNYCSQNIIEMTQEAYNDFSVTCCTSCGVMMDELNYNCPHCAAAQGEGFSYQEIVGRPGRRIFLSGYNGLLEKKMNKNKNKAYIAFHTYCSLNIIEMTQEAYNDFSVTRCTSCGTMKEELNTNCPHCAAAQGEGFSYQEIMDYRPFIPFSTCPF